MFARYCLPVTKMYQQVSIDASKAAQGNLPKCSTDLVTLAKLAMAKFASGSALNSIRIDRFEGEPIFSKHISQPLFQSQSFAKKACGTRQVSVASMELTISRIFTYREES